MKRLRSPDGHIHRFRDTFAVRLLENGLSVETVSVLRAHSNIALPAVGKVAAKRASQVLFLTGLVPPGLALIIDFLGPSTLSRPGPFVEAGCRTAGPIATSPR